MLTEIASAGLAAGLAAGGYAYAGKSPVSQIFGPTVIAGGDVRQIALTYDDGPNEPYTEQLLEILATHRVRATFFLVGNFVRLRPQIARAVRQAGHLIGNHTLTHPNLMLQSPRRVRQELIACTAAIEDAIGERIAWFRPPFGLRRPDVLRTARELGLVPVLWNVTGYDWNERSVERLVQRVRSGIERNRSRRRSSSVLLHDGGHLGLGADRSVTIATTRILLEAWAGSGVEMVTPEAWSQ